MGLGGGGFVTGGSWVAVEALSARLGCGGGGGGTRWGRDVQGGTGGAHYARLVRPCLVGSTSGGRVGDVWSRMGDVRGETCGDVRRVGDVSGVASRRDAFPAATAAPPAALSRKLLVIQTNCKHLYRFLGPYINSCA